MTSGLHFFLQISLKSVNKTKSKKVVWRKPMTILFTGTSIAWNHFQLNSLKAEVVIIFALQIN